MNESDQNSSNAVNIASYLVQAAKFQPAQRAVVYPIGRDSKGHIAYSHLTFAQLDREIARSTTHIDGALDLGQGEGTNRTPSPDHVPVG